MTIQPIHPSTPPNTSTSSTQSAAGSTAPSEQMFLQLLVAQIKNQDPTNPADGTQFVAQLAQFSQLEQTIAIRQNMDILAKAATQPAVPAE
jgi:flagellar basal-body rod modification protein FlgD